MSIRVEENNPELDKLVAKNEAAGDWVTSIPTPVVSLLGSSTKLDTPAETLKARQSVP